MTSLLRLSPSHQAQFRFLCRFSCCADLLQPTPACLRGLSIASLVQTFERCHGHLLHSRASSCPLLSQFRSKLSYRSIWHGCPLKGCDLVQASLQPSVGHRSRAGTRRRARLSQQVSVGLQRMWSFDWHPPVYCTPRRMVRGGGRYFGTLRRRHGHGIALTALYTGLHSRLALTCRQRSERLNNKHRSCTWSSNARVPLQ